MRKFGILILTIAICWFAAYVVEAAELSGPSQVTANAGLNLSFSGGGSGNSDATFYLFGPSHVSKRTVKIGEQIAIAPEETRSAGRYTALLRSGDAVAVKVFYVNPAAPGVLNFLARPSRVPAAKPGVISGVAFVFDDYKNLALASTPVKFDLAVAGARAVSRTVPSQQGIAWVRMDSGRTQGAAQFVASLPAAHTEDQETASVRRVVQQVAADACNLHIKAQRTSSNIVVETDPVRDCSGNAVPDGTIITFTELDSSGRSTVDARVKRDVARAELPLSNDATISVASGVVVGNELHIGGAQ
jgi:hypothetical protein